MAARLLSDSRSAGLLVVVLLDSAVCVASEFFSRSIPCLVLFDLQAESPSRNTDLLLHWDRLIFLLTSSLLVLPGSWLPAGLEVLVLAASV